MSISIDELTRILCERKGAEIFTFYAETTPKTWKRNRITGELFPYSSIVHKAIVNGLLNCDYQKNVNKQRVREGKKPDFEAKKNWFVHIPNTPFVRNANKDDGKIYVQIRVRKFLYSAYFVDGKQVTRESISGWLSKKRKPVNQGLDRDIISIVYNINDFREIHKTGKVLTVDGPKLIAGPVETEEVEQDALA